MRIKSLIIQDEETGKEYAFTHRSVVEVKEYEAAKDPEVQGTGLTDIIPITETATTVNTTMVESLKTKKKKAKKAKK